MANKKNNRSGTWKKERASVDKKNKSRPQSNKYSSSDRSQREDNSEQYWRAGYTRKNVPHLKYGGADE